MSFRRKSRGGRQKQVIPKVLSGCLKAYEDTTNIQVLPRYLQILKLNAVGFFFNNYFVSCVHAAPLHKCHRIPLFIKCRFRTHCLVSLCFFVLFWAHTLCFLSSNRTSCVYPPFDILLVSLHMTERANSSSTLIGKQNLPLLVPSFRLVLSPLKQKLQHNMEY